MGFPNLLSMVESVVSAEGYNYVWAVVITGLAVVFLALVILIAFVWLMGKIFSIGSNKKKITPEPAKTVPVPVKAAPVQPSVVNNTDNDEVIAVIAAAVAAMGQADGKNYKVKSVRAVSNNNRASRSAWSMAGLQHNTAPF